jgi:DNA-binding cell septation regulator SpoVG
MGDQTVSTTPTPELVITECMIWPVRNGDNSRVKAMVSITFNHALRISGCRIIEGAKGLFLAYPSEKKAGPDQWFPLVMPVDRKYGDDIQAAVLKRFHDLAE